MTSTPDALIGFSGFVGGTLTRQTEFGALYRSSNIGEIEGTSFGRVICAGAPAQKWLANRDPAADRANIDVLIAHLRTVRCRKFVLISTVDVFKAPIGMDERTPVDERDLSAYGLNRRRLEMFVERQFPEYLIVRLPGLVGPGLRKNILFDLLNDNNVAAIDSRGVFQFYPMVNLWLDVERALAMELRLLHLTAEPISVAEVAAQGFGIKLTQPSGVAPSRYDMRTLYAAEFGGAGHYQYDRRASVLAIRAYSQSEARSLPVAASRQVP